MELSAGKYYVWYGDTKYHAIHAKKRGRIALVSGEKAMKEIIESVNAFNAMNQQRDELLAIVKDMRNAKSEVLIISPEGRKYLAKMDAAIAKCES